MSSFRISRVFQSSLCLFTILVFGGISFVIAQDAGKNPSEGFPWTSSIFDKTTLLAPAVNLDQCRNGSPTAFVVCQGSAFQNGNLGKSNSHYKEGDSVPYRLIVSGLTSGSSSNTVTIGYDTTENGKHALDYLTRFNRTETNADVCTGSVPGCSQFSDFPVPTDPNVTAGGVTPASGSFFRIYGGTISSVSAYSISGNYSGSSQTSITLTFSSTGGTVVIAWGGHISTRSDWGVNNSAIDISGSPYHMRIDGGGNQDRSLSADAVIFPAQVTIIKEVTTPGGGTTSLTSFPFTSTRLSSAGFSLVDNNVAGPDRFIDADIKNFGASSSITVTEGLVTGWTLSDITCVETAGGAPNTINTTVNLGTRTATIVAERGELITCTFSNQQLTPTAANAIIAGRVVDENGRGISRTMVRLLNTATSGVTSVMTNPFGYYRIENLPIGEFYVLSLSSKSYEFTHNHWGFSLIEDSTFDFVGIPRAGSLVNPDADGAEIGPWSKPTKP